MIAIFAPESNAGTILGASHEYASRSRVRYFSRSNQNSHWLQSLQCRRGKPVTGKRKPSIDDVAEMTEEGTLEKSPKVRGQQGEAVLPQ